MYSIRDYRFKHNSEDLINFKINYKETDLWVGVDRKSYYEQLPAEIETYVVDLREELEAYIQLKPEFYVTLKPFIIQDDMPPIAKTMAMAAAPCGVGPMAAVAGTFSDYVGNFLREKCKEIIIENGGDIYIRTQKPRTVAIFAGNSPFSDRIGIKIKAYTTRGVCTSSGTVGPSLSLGKSDATLVVAKTAAAADAAATMLGNMVQTEEDVAQVINFAQKQKNILGALIIKNDKLGACGEIEIVPLDK